MKIKVSEAQASALECRPLEDLPGTFQDRILTFEDPEAMADWLCEASNAEDAFAQQYRGDPGGVFAARAARSLAVLMTKTWKTN